MEDETAEALREFLKEFEGSVCAFLLEADSLEAAEVYKIKIAVHRFTISGNHLDW